jgi:hypothetical protein
VRRTHCLGNRIWRGCGYKQTTNYTRDLFSWLLLNSESTRGQEVSPSVYFPSIGLGLVQSWA